MTYYEPQTAKKVFLYKNGTINSDAKRFVVSERQIRDFSSFLNRVTSGLRAPAAVRNIYTPNHGTKVRSLDELVSGKYYVAGGSEQFKRVKYGTGPKLLPRRQQRVEFTTHQVPLPHVIVAESRYKRPVEKPFTIHLFRNGDEHFHGKRVLLHRSEMASWDNVLQIVTEKAELNTPAKKLCTLDGELVTQVQDGGKYVAVEAGKMFRKVAYCATAINPLRRKRAVPMTLPQVTRRWQKPRGTRTHPSLLPPPISLSNTDTIPRPQPPPIDPTATLQVPPRRKIRPMAGRKNKEARERALLENRDDSVFGGSPVMQSHPRMPSPPLSASTANLLHGLPASRAIGEAKRPSLTNYNGIAVSNYHEANQRGVVTKFSMEVKKPIENETQKSNLTQNQDRNLTPHTLQEESNGQESQFLPEQATHDQNIIIEGDGSKWLLASPLPESNHNINPSNMASNSEIKNTRDSSILPSNKRAFENEEKKESIAREEEEEDSIREVSFDEGRVENEKETVENKEVKSNLVQIITNTQDKTDQSSIAQPEEVVEEVGVAERSEVKEDTEEPKMRLQEQEVELVSEDKKTSIDLTMTRKTQQSVIDSNEGSNDITPPDDKSRTPAVTTPQDMNQPTNSSGNDESTVKSDTPAPPTNESQATPPASPTDDEDQVQLIVNDSQ